MTSVDPALPDTMRTPRPRATTADVTRGLDLSGHVSVVTGASGGLGFETARALAAAGAHVVLASRDPDRTDAVARAIRAQCGSGSASVVHLDLGSLDNVRAAARSVAARCPSVHSVIANAGVMAVPAGLTTDGFETHFGVNHLGHFVFVNHLAGVLAEGAPSRVVMVSSLGHRWSDIDLTDLNWTARRYRRFSAYGASKTANVLFATEFDRRWARHGVRAFALHPGGIETDLGRHLSDNDRAKLWSGEAARAAGAAKTVAEGAATSVWAAVSPELVGLGGRYLEDCAVAAVEPTTTDGACGVAPFAVDAERAGQLWQRSEQLVGERFPAPARTGVGESDRP